ncbi:MAG: hypothetical protein LQ343_001502 [Gyalolechia ehrenbergii]|nr:MAG: hypothetical protein LQ343_001502 [Gyalolechia ehrenbergii]
MTTVDNGPEIQRLEEGNRKERGEDFQDDQMAWDNPQNLRNPVNWSNKRKWTNVVLISLQATLSPMSSSILAVGAQSIAADFALTNIYLPALPVGTYVLGLGLAGACGSAGPTLGAASIGDMFLRRERGKAQSLYALGPTAGPILAPLIGAFVADRTHGWRWLMWVMVIASAVTVLLCLLLLKETYGPFLLQKEAKKSLQSSGDSGDLTLRTKLSVRSLLGCATLRPLQLLFLSPLCTIMSLYMAL